MKLIHYGSSIYKPEIFIPIQNENWVKPKGGLWTSPVNSNWGWIDWCTSEDWGSKKDDDCFLLELLTQRIFIIDSYSDLVNAPKHASKYSNSPFFKNEFIDFELLSKEYDAIWLTERGRNETHLSHPLNLYGWDCESVLIMNPSSCIQIENITA